jgi:hypothetical protein
MEPSSNLRNSDLSPQNERKSTAYNVTVNIEKEWVLHTSELSADGPMFKIEKA